MIGTIAAFAGGIAVGVGLLLAHQWSVRRALRQEKARARRDVDKLLGENARLREDIAAYELSSEAARAREQGKIVGLREGMNQSNYSRFAQSLQGESGKRSVQIGGAGR